MTKHLYRAAFVGAGNMGRNQARAFKAHPCVAFAGVYDTSQENAEKFATEFQTEAFTSLNALLDPTKIDLLVVSTPPSQRLEIYRKATQLGIPVLLEKPIAHHYADAKRMVDLEKSTQTLSAVGYCHRFVPAVREILALKQSGQYGGLRWIAQKFIVGAGGRRLKESWMSDPAVSGGGVIMDTMCHSLDLAQFLGGELVECDGQLEHAWPGRAETSATVVGKTVEGVTVDLTGSWDYPVQQFDLRVIFDHAEVYYNYRDPFYTISKEGEPALVQIPVESYTVRVPLQASAFVEALAGNKTALCTMEEGLRVSRVIDALYQQHAARSK